MKKLPDSTIEQARAVGRQFEEASDAAFAEGDALHGAQYFRWALLAFNHAQELAQRWCFGIDSEAAPMMTRNLFQSEQFLPAVHTTVAGK
jgi:hypothetical protein